MNEDLITLQANEGFFGFYVLNLVTLDDYKNNIDSYLYFKTLYPAQSKIA